jgi:hypothetical protein
MLTNGLIGMAVAAIGVLFMLGMSASITQEKFDKALEKQSGKVNR